MKKKDVLDTLRDLSPDADTSTVGGFRLWKQREYPTRGTNYRFAWKWLYSGSHPAQRYDFGGVNSMHEMADIVMRLHRQHGKSEA